MKTASLLRSVTQWKAHALALAVSYAVLPAALWAAGWMFPHRMDLRVALAIVGAAPCTLASAALVTRQASGNDALALALTISSNMVNFIVAPIVLTLTAASSTEGAADPVAMGQSILLLVVVPVAIGQAMRWKFSRVADRWEPVLSWTARGLILLMVLMSVSKAVTSPEANELQPIQLGGLFAGLATAHVLAMALAHWGGKLLRLDRGDRIACLIAGSQKTLPVGVYLARTFFPNWPLATLGIVLYHAMQLTLDSAVAERLRASQRSAESNSP